MVGCSTLFDPAPNEPGLIQPSARARQVINQVGEATGPWGLLAATVANAALTAWASARNQRALKKHIEDTKPNV